jgi:hypothetical protein
MPVGYKQHREVAMFVPVRAHGSQQPVHLGFRQVLAGAVFAVRLGPGMMMPTTLAPTVSFSAVGDTIRRCIFIG